MMPAVIFALPFTVNSELARKLRGRVVVLDLSFCADTHRATYAQTTLPFIEELGDRLVFWIDHHEHERHIDFAHDARFVLSNRRESPATPEMVTPELVKRAEKVDTIVAHGDLDGIYAAAKFLLGGAEPYPGADADARAADSRIGEMSPIAQRIDNALKAGVSTPETEAEENAFRQTVLGYLTSRLNDAEANAEITTRAAAYEAVENRTTAWAKQYIVQGTVAVVDIREETERVDLTQLLLAGQRLAEVAMVRYCNIRTGAPQIAIAAATDSGYNFVEMFGLSGGMPTRVTLPDDRFEEAIERLSKRGEEA